MDALTQIAPYPLELAELVRGLKYKPGWKFFLEMQDRGQGSKGLTLKILTKGYDTYHPEDGEEYRVWHYMIVPAASYNLQSWRRWLFTQILLVENHEAAEFFQIDGSRPYAPLHGPGNDPYLIAELATDEQRKTNYKGELIADKEP